MPLIRIILWTLVIYLIIKTIRNIGKILMGNNSSSTQKEKFYNREPKYKIKKEDIVEAEYEDITTSESEKSNKKS